MDVLADFKTLGESLVKDNHIIDFVLDLRLFLEGIEDITKVETSEDILRDIVNKFIEKFRIWNKYLANGSDTVLW